MGNQKFKLVNNKVILQIFLSLKPIIGKAHKKLLSHLLYMSSLKCVMSVLHVISSDFMKYRLLAVHFI